MFVNLKTCLNICISFHEKTFLLSKSIYAKVSCIKIKYGQKILEKMWTEIRTSLNQKCLDKLKQHRRSLSDQQNPDDVE